MQPSSDFHYVRLADDLAGTIQTGAFQPGDRLPSIRELRRRSGFSISTVMQAYAELERRGLVEARPRSGFFVSAIERRLPMPKMERGLNPTPPAKVTINPLARLVAARFENPDAVPLGTASPSPEYLPLKKINRLLKTIPAKAMGALCSYGPPAGSKGLRTLLARRMAGGVKGGRSVAAEELILTNGCMEAVTLSLRAVARPGDAVVVESPAFVGFLQAIEDLGLYAVEVPTCPARGVDPESFERALEDTRVKAVLLVSNFHNPTGATIPDEVKPHLVSAAMRRGIPIIEDDVYGDLHFGESRPRTLKSFDAEGAVLYCSSFSKVLAPGLRVGWVAPGRYLERVQRLKLETTITSAPLNQYIVAGMLEGGDYDRHLRRIRTVLKNNMQSLSQAVARHFPEGTRMTMPGGGFLLWVELPGAVDGEALFEEAREAGISIAPGVICSPSRRYRNFIRLGAGYPFNAAMERGVARLAALVARRA